MGRGGGEQEGGSKDIVLVPMEEMVQALIEHLVSPLLSSKASLHESPSFSKQESVGKQIHAVVLLYNYYYRKQFPDLEFLYFEDFCKVVVNARPNLLAYMKFMQRCNDESGELDTQLSITEEMVMSACNICRELDALDASGDASSIEKWRVSKVAVFVVDSMKSNCLLQFSSKTQGVWSPIEKDLDTTTKGDSQMKGTNRKRRVLPRGSRNELLDDEAVLQQLAFTAVKEQTGIVQTDLIILESHSVYALSKEKSACRFYLMQYTKELDGEVIQVPIEDVVGSLRRPLVSKRFNTYEVTPVVEYFHLLPYADIISDWLSRKSSDISPQNLPDQLGNLVRNCSPKVDEPCTEKGDESHMLFNWTKQTAEAQDSETCRSKNGPLSEKDNGDCCISGSSAAVCSPQLFADDSSLNHSGQPCQEAINSVKNTTNPDAHVEKRNKSLTARGPKASQNGIEGKAEMTDSAKKSCNAEKRSVTQKIRSDDFAVSGDVPLVPSPSSCPNLDKLELVLASKGDDLLKSALRALQIKRDELCHQHRQLEDELALCEKNIEAVLSGGEDDLMLKIESIINACNAACSKGACRSQTEESLPQSCKRKRFSEAILILRNPCQELDDICTVNNWILPRYSVQPSDGGFLANVTVKGLDFEFSGGGDLQSNPSEARESAASRMLSKMRSMAKQLQ